MININSVAAYEGDDYESFLEKCQLIHIFESVIQSYKHNKPVLKQIIKYITYAYSIESEHVVVKIEWGETKKKIFEYVMLPDAFYKDVVLLESISVVETIIKWLDAQDSEVYKQMCILKDLKLEYQRSLYAPSAECSYEQKFDNATYIEKVTVMINNLQSNLIQNSEKLRTGSIEVRTAKKKNVIGVEKFAKNVRN